MIWLMCYGGWCPDTILIITELLLDGTAHMHDASGLPHDAGSICLVRCIFIHNVHPVYVCVMEIRTYVCVCE